MDQSLILKLEFLFLLSPIEEVGDDGENDQGDDDTDYKAGEFTFSEFRPGVSYATSSLVRIGR
jgi:hypothetical protein